MMKEGINVCSKRMAKRVMPAKTATPGTGISITRSIEMSCCNNDTCIFRGYLTVLRVVLAPMPAARCVHS